MRGDWVDYLLARFDRATLELVASEVLDPNRLAAAGVGIALIQGPDFEITLQPAGAAGPSELNRPRFSPEGSSLWAVSDDIELLIDVATGKPIGRFELGKGHIYYAWSRTVPSSSTPPWVPRSRFSGHKIFRP